MIITTAADETQFLIEKALKLSLRLKIEYRPRRKKSLKYLFENVDPQIFVVNNTRGVSYYEQGGIEAFYHPNMAFHRIINLKKGCRDSMADVCRLESGTSFFDGTLGLAADSLTASYAAGESGEIVATEKSFSICVIVEEGLKFYAEQYPETAPIIERISIKNIDNLDFLRQCGELSFDVVYFDFMFNRPVANSTGIRVIRNLASRDTITAERIDEAVRVAKRRVVVKSNGEDLRDLLELGFTIEKTNPRGNFCYAVLEKTQNGVGIYNKKGGA